MTMTENVQIEALREAFTKYRTPDPSIVDQLPRGGTTLSYVGHAECTAVLISIDPLWTWEPRAWDDETGGPKIYQRGGHLMLWGFLTLLGKTMPCVGTAEAKKAERTDVEKELIGDLLRNGAMRFGIFVDLWAKDHPEADLPAERPAARPVAAERAQEGHGQDSPRWQAVRERLMAMGDKRAPIVDSLVAAGLFKEDRTPKLPYSVADMTKVEGMVPFPSQAAPPPPQAEVTDTVGPLHPEHAVETVLLATGKDEVPDDLDPIFWYMAEYANADEIDWQAVAKGLNLKGPALLKMARELAAGLMKAHPDVAVQVPDILNEIHGTLAVELRALLIKDALGQPY